MLKSEDQLQHIFGRILLKMERTGKYNFIMTFHRQMYKVSRRGPVLLSTEITPRSGHSPLRTGAASTCRSHR